jgi:predicted regulator of Ras-like GTPase activity (Roadblock/LC7/MglB family)
MQMPVLTIQASDQLIEILEDFLHKSEANFTMVIDRGGSVLSEHGTVDRSVDTAIVGALAAGSFAATKELAQRIGEVEFSALHQQGEQTEVFMCGVDDDAVFVSIFGPQTTLGLVRFYSARTAKRIAAILRESRSSHAATPVFSQRDVHAAQHLFGS